MFLKFVAKAVKSLEIVDAEGLDLQVWMVYTLDSRPGGSGIRVHQAVSGLREDGTE